MGNIAMCKYVRGKHEVTLPMWDKFIEDIPKTLNIHRETVPLNGTYKRIATDEKVTSIDVTTLKLNKDVYLEGWDPMTMMMLQKRYLKPVKD